MEEPLLRLTGVEVRHGTFAALAGVDLEVGRRQVVGIVGTNGAGKTTLCDVVCGYARPAVGEVTWRGERVTGRSPKRLHRMGIARTVQGLGLGDRHTVRETVRRGVDRHARQRGWTPRPRGAEAERELRERVEAVLHDLRLTEHADRLPTELPHAARARVAIARALASLPELLVLDEPATGLSVEEAADLSTVLTRIARRTSVLLVDHHLPLLDAVSDQLVVLDGGQVVTRTTPEEVRARPELLAPYLG